MTGAKKDADLGASFGAVGLLKEAEGHSQAGQNARRRGSREVAETHLTRGVQALHRLGEVWVAENPEPAFPRLSKKENADYYAAMQRLYEGTNTKSDIDMLEQLTSKLEGDGLIS